MKSVEVVKETEKVAVVPGWYWIPTAQSRANLISYLLEPETDDNLITWGWADHMLEVRPRTVDEGLAALAAAMEIDLAAQTEQRRAQLRAQVEKQLTARQRVPMIRVMTHQMMPVIEAVQSGSGRPPSGQ